MSQAASSLLLELFFFRLSARLPLRCLQLLGESAGLMALALLFPFVLRLSQGGIIALFLISATLMKRIQFLIDEHRDNIWVHGMTNRRSHFIFASSTASVFLGVFTVVLLFFIILQSTQGPLSVRQYFEFIYQTGSISQGTTIHQRIHSVTSILINNYLVLLTTLLLTLVYRTLGLILILTWNAFVWAVVFAALNQQAWLTTKLNPFVFILQTLLALSPHLLMETVAYILGAMAALFISKALTLYHLTDERFRQTAQASLQLLIASCLLLLLAGIVENILPAALMPR